VLILASASPRRTQLLDQLGVAHKVQPAGIDETPYPFEDPVAYVRRMALGKATVGLLQAASNPVLAADTVVFSGCLLLGKPADRAAGLQMLARLSGRTHQVYTAVCLLWGHRRACTWVCTQVNFRSVSMQAAQAYWDLEAPLDKAGGYGIQGSAIGFVKKIEGSISNVVGLPLAETGVLLEALGPLP
jgi:septum formation protein